MKEVIANFVFGVFMVDIGLFIGVFWIHPAPPPFQMIIGYKTECFIDGQPVSIKDYQAVVCTPDDGIVGRNTVTSTHFMNSSLDN